MAARTESDSITVRAIRDGLLLRERLFTDDEEALALDYLDILVEAYDTSLDFPEGEPSEVSIQMIDPRGNILAERWLG